MAKIWGIFLLGFVVPLNLMKKDEILINVQFALFFDKPIAEPENLGEKLNESMGGIFDTKPVIVPVPSDDQLNDIPVVQLKSNNIYSSNIARARADFLMAGNGPQKFNDIKEEFTEKVGLFKDFFAGKSNIKRIGFVVRNFIKDENDKAATASKVLISTLTQLCSGPAVETYIRYGSRDTWNSIEINNYISIEEFSARIIGASEKGGDGILITRDFSTAPGQNYKEELKTVDLLQFIEYSESKFNLEKIKEILWQ